MKRFIAYISAAAMLSTAFAAMTAVPAAAADEENLLANGGFESAVQWSNTYTATGAWYCYKEGDNFAWTTTEQYTTGSQSGTVWNGKIGQLVALETGDYTLTAYVLTWGANGVLGLYDTGISAVATTSLPDTNGIWQEVSLDITCATDASYVVQFSSSDGTTVCVDDISLTKKEAVNSITNADFSDGTSGWTLSGGKASVNNGALQIKGNKYTQTVSQTLTGLDAGTYDLTLDVTNSAISGTYYAYAKAAGHTMVSTALPQTLAAMTVTVPGIATAGTVEIGVYAAGSSTITLDNFCLSTSAESRLPLLKGGEISKLTYVEDNGGTFYRADGTEGDALQIMAENGFNLARIRVLNDPGKGHGDGTYYLPEGYQTVDDCLELARRAKAKGMQIEFTFAYSDYWVDGDKQIIPHEWQEEMTARGITATADKVDYLEDKVESYTKDVLRQLVAQGTTPEYVSIGNEMQAGMFFGTGYEGDLYYKKDYLLRFVNAGAKAVREVCPSAKVVIHTDNGGKVFEWLNANWDATAYQYLLKRADYDVMAVSYYPYYNSDISIDDIVTEFNYCVNNLNKDVMIMESGYNFNAKRSDGYEGQLQDNGYYQSSYGESETGQRAFLTELYNKLKTVSGGRCIGVSYWDPIMITDNVGWAISESGDYTQGNVISNSTIFKFNGRPTDGQLAMKHNTNSNDKILITGKLTKDNAVYANGSATLHINGANYAVTSDAYGDYIAAVSYPSGDLTITADHSEQSYTKDAPTDGILVSGVNFTITETVTKPEAYLSAANWTAAEGSGYTASGNTLTRGGDTLYAYMATLTGNGVAYDTIKVYAESMADSTKTATQTYTGVPAFTDGEVTFYVLSNAMLNAENSKVYCE